MHDLQFADELVDRIRKSGARYHERAYLFVLASIEYLQTRLDARRHVSAAEVAWACRDVAHQQYGLMAESVLAHWGVHRTSDLGRIVYILVEAGVLMTQPGDREDDFADVFEFADALTSAYAWNGVPPNGASHGIE